MKPRRSLVRLTLAGALVFGPACEQQTSPSRFAESTPPFTIPTPTLTCSAEQSSSRYASFKVTLTGGGDNTPHSTIVDFGDGFEARDTLYSSDRGPRDSRSYSHRYERNGTYVIEGTVRNTITNDRLSCSRTVVFDRCEGSILPDAWDDFTFDGRWSRSAVKDSPGIVETASLQRSGGNPDGYQRMTHEFTATTAPVFVSMFVYHVFQGTNGFHGPIDHIMYREDRIKFAALTATSAVGGGALIVQNGINHIAPLTGGQFSNSSSWERVEMPLHASDFTPAPDFSETAAPMFLGFYRANSNRFPLVIEHGIDNWRVQICR